MWSWGQPALHSFRASYKARIAALVYCQARAVVQRCPMKMRLWEANLRLRRPESDTDVSTLGADMVAKIGACTGAGGLPNNRAAGPVQAGSMGRATVDLPGMCFAI